MLCVRGSPMNGSRTAQLGKSATPGGGHFAFGENWKSFLAELDDGRIVEAEKSLQWLSGRQRLDRLGFVDIGSGSGLSSLAARRLGAVVHSFDYDAQSVECTKLLRDCFFADDSSWLVEQGSILDRDYLAGLGRFDVVFSWGVLHHTGVMHEAIENASRLVAPGGMLIFALYRKTRLCRFWTWEKCWYSQASARGQSVARRLYVALMRLAFTLAGRNFTAYVSNYRSNRGMDFNHDVHDWLGGYPYESIGPAAVAQHMKDLGFSHVRSTVRPYSTGWFGSGCDEYVYNRIGG